MRSPFAHRELSDRAHVLAAVLDRCAEGQRVRAGDRDAGVRDPPHPGNRPAVVEANDELGDHVDVAAHALDDAHDVRRFPTRRHEVQHANRARVRLPFRFEHERAGAVAAAALPCVTARRDDPAAMVGVTEDGGEARAGVEARKARPVDRAVTADECRRLQVADQAVVLDPRHQRSSISSANRRKRRSDCAVERLLVLLRRVLVEGRREVVAKVGKHLGCRLDEVDVVAIAFFRLAALGPVVRTLGGDAVLDETALLALEQIELPLDQVGETRAPESHVSSR